MTRPIRRIAFVIGAVIACLGPGAWWLLGLLVAVIAAVASMPPRAEIEHTVRRWQRGRQRAQERGLDGYARFAVAHRVARESAERTDDDEIDSEIDELKVTGNTRRIRA